MGEQSPYILRKDIFTEWRTILPFGSGSSLKRLLTDFPSNRYKRKRLTAGLTAGLSLCVCAYILLKTPIVVTLAEMVEILKDKGLDL